MASERKTARELLELLSWVSGPAGTRAVMLTAAVDAAEDYAAQEVARAIAERWAAREVSDHVALVEMSRDEWKSRAEAAEAELRLLTVGEIIDEERSASRLGDPSEKVHAVERRLRLEAHGRLEHYEQSGAIPPPPHGAASWLDYLAAHQHIGTRGCWQCEAARWARLERDATRAEVARLRALLEGGEPLGD